jgi:hypothetical protein
MTFPADRKPLILVIATLGLVTLLLFLRRPDTFLNPQLWAEDGALFLVQQREQGLAALFNSYSGYYHLAPRLIAVLGGAVPLLYIPLFYNMAALVVALLVALYILRTGTGLGPHPIVFALALFLVPTAGEFFMNMASVQWVLAVAVPFLYAQPAFTEWKRSLTSAGLMVFIGLTGPFVLFSLPLLLLRRLTHGKITPQEALFSAGVLTAALIQGFNVIRSYEENTGNPVSFNCYQVLAERFGARMYFGNLLPKTWPVVTAAAAVLFLVITFAASPFIEQGQRRRFALLWMAFGTTTYLAALQRFSFNPLVLDPFGRGTRYFYLPYLGFFFVYLLMAASKTRLRWIGRAGVALMLFSSFTYFTSPPLEDYHWKDHIQQLERSGTATVPINPHWHIELRTQ